MVIPTEAEKRMAQEEANATQAKKLSDSNFNLIAALSPAGPSTTPVTPKTGGETLKIRLLAVETMNKIIKGKIVNKSFRREYGKGSVFSFDLMDTTGTIRINVFSSNQNFEDIFVLIQVNNLIRLGGFRVGLKNVTYNTLDHSCKITWLPCTTAIEIEPDELQALSIEFDFVKLNDAMKLAPGTVLDTIGIITEVGNIQETGRGQLRIFTLVDDSKTQILIHLWKNSTNVEPDRGSVVAIKHGKVQDSTYMNVTSRHLAPNSETLFWLDPELDRAKELLTWMNSELVLHK